MAHEGLEGAAVRPLQHHFAAMGQWIAEGNMRRHAGRNTIGDQIVQALPIAAVVARQKTQPTRQGRIHKQEAAVLIDRIEADRRMFDEIGEFLVVGADEFFDLALRRDHLGAPEDIAGKAGDAAARDVVPIRGATRRHNLDLGAAAPPLGNA